LDQLSNEIAVLGACIIEPGCVGEIADYIAPEDFSRDEHRLIYDALLSLWRMGEPVNEIAISSNLKERKLLKSAGGAAYLASITGDLPDVANVGFYADRVKRGSLSRRLMLLGSHISNAAEDDPHEAMNRAMEQLVDLSASSLRSVPQTIGHYAGVVAEESIAIAEKRTTRNVIKTGMPKFDEVTDGLSPADLIVIAAQPSVGKSAFSLHISRLVSDQNLPVLFVSLEMSGKQIATRMLAADTGIPYTWIQDGKLGEMAKAQLMESRRKLDMLPFVIDDKAGQTISDIRTRARREQARSGLALMVVDYLQIATSTPDDVGEVARISTGLKGIAKDLSIPVIALSQMSRNIQHRDSKEPILADLKQSSQIEQDADLVSFLYHRDKRKLNELTFVIKKHRNGALGEVEFFFDKECQRFNELSGRRY
jgi:replicative DNA helicase